MQQLYEERIRRIKTTANHTEPDRIPVFSMAQTFCIGYAGSTVNECLESTEKEFSVYGKTYADFDFDAAMVFGFNKPMKVYDALGFSAYIIDADGKSYQRKDGAMMGTEDYPDFINDPFKKYIQGSLLKRKYPLLSSPYPQNLKALQNALQEFLIFSEKNIAAEKYLKENFGVPYLSGSTVIPALDYLISYARDFSGGLSDLRRRPGQVKAALESLHPFILSNVTNGRKMPEFPFCLISSFISGNLSKKHFDEFQWPGLSEIIWSVINAGGKAAVLMQGSWRHIYDHLLEFPKSSVIALLENDDAIQAKKDIGASVTIAGGMPLQLLKNGSVQQCIDHTKRIIGKCAPGGGFILNQDKVLLYSQDADHENLKAVIETAHEYGKY